MLRQKKAKSTSRKHKTNEQIIEQLLRQLLGQDQEQEESTEEPEQPTEEELAEQQLALKQERRNIREYRRSMRNFIMTSRFNEETRMDNERFRQRKLPNGAVYCTPLPVSKTIPFRANMMVLEMNNETNRIIGVGLVSNRPKFEEFAVYQNSEYNRYMYFGKYRIAREDMTQEEETVMQIFDRHCFYGNRHMKRGHGIAMFPPLILFRCKPTFDLVAFMENMFKRRMKREE